MAPENPLLEFVCPLSPPTPLFFPPAQVKRDVRFSHLLQCPTPEAHTTPLTPPRILFSLGRSHRLIQLIPLPRFFFFYRSFVSLIPPVRNLKTAILLLVGVVGGMLKCGLYRFSFPPPPLFPPLLARRFCMRFYGFFRFRLPFTSLLL